MTQFFSLLNLSLCMWLAFFSSLSVSAPLEFNKTLTLLKRVDTLFTIWSSIPGAQIVKGDSALSFPIDQSVKNAWGVTYLYGCTALLISDPNFVIVAHMQQESKTGKICINEPAAVNNWLENKLLPELDLYPPGPQTEVNLIHNALDCQSSRDFDGVKYIKKWLTNPEGYWELPDTQIKSKEYTGSSGLGTPIPGQPRGLAAIRWLSPSSPDTLGRIQVFFGSETPLRDTTFVPPS